MQAVRKPALTIAAAIWFSMFSSADTDIHECGPLVVTATGSERIIETVPARINILDADSIRSLPVMHVDELLAGMAGVNIQRPSGIYSLRPVVTLRGLGGDEQGRTLVLLDGVPINKADTGGVNWSRIGLENIERIEIARGPGSSLYGNQAMGGVINIISRRPAAPLEGEVRLGYGSHNTLDARYLVAGAQTPDAGWYWQLSGRYLDSEGYDATPAEQRTDYTVDRFAEQLALSAKAGYRIAEVALLEFVYDYYDNLYGEGEKIQANRGAVREYDTDFYRMLYRGPLGQWETTVDAFYQKEAYGRVVERMRGANYERFDVESDREDFGSTLAINRRFEGGRYLRVGSELREGRVSAADVYKTSPTRVENAGKMRFYALYLQAETALEAQQKWSLLAALRYDYAEFFDGEYFANDPTWEVYNGSLDDNSWDHFSPRGGLNFLPVENLRAYIAYGRGFRASILDDLCRSGWMWVGPKIANPELKPEKLDNLDIGLDWTSLDRRWKIAPTVFYSRGRDFLYYVDSGEKLWGTRTIWRRENVGEVTVAGLELEAACRINDAWQVFSAYTYNHTEIRQFNERPELERNQLTYTPPNRATLGIKYNLPVWGFSIQGIYKDRQFADDANTERIDSYLTADAAVWFRHHRTASEIRLTGQNLLNEEYLENATTKGPGATVKLELAYAF